MMPITAATLIEIRNSANAKLDDLAAQTKVDNFEWDGLKNLAEAASSLLRLYTLRKNQLNEPHDART